MPTIFALASGRPPAAVAIIRISGPGAVSAAQALMSKPLPPVRTMALRQLVDPRDAVSLDTAMVVHFAAPASSTGEDVVELHLHGGPAVVAAVLAALGRIGGLRLARPGEFTRRGFDNGKLDLSQVEGLADLIDAETEAQRRQALLAAGGGLRDRVDGWRATLIDVRADLEATLDFDEEDGVPAGLSAANRVRLTGLAAGFDAALADARRGERIRDGLTVAITGPPNTGKSSLVNALARRPVAIVSEHPGTTRDVIEVRLDLNGVAVTLIDTAGLRDSSDPVEREGIARGRARAAAADLILALGSPPPPGGLGIAGMADLRAGAGWRDGILDLSARTGDGVGLLLDWLTAWAHRIVRPADAVVVTRERQRSAIVVARTEITDAAAAKDAVLIAEHLRVASDALTAITGRIGAEDILDGIFSRFCIGK